MRNNDGKGQEADSWATCLTAGHRPTDHSPGALLPPLYLLDPTLAKLMVTLFLIPLTSLTRAWPSEKIC